MKLGVSFDGIAPYGEALGFAQEAVSPAVLFAVLVPTLRRVRQAVRHE